MKLFGEGARHSSMSACRGDIQHRMVMRQVTMNAKEGGSDYVWNIVLP